MEAATMPETESTLLVIYDASCMFCRAAERWLRRHDRWTRLRFEPIADVVDTRGHHFGRAVLDAEMHVVDGGGRVYRGFRAWRRIVRDVPILMPLLPLLWLPGASLVGDRVYHWVAAHRSVIGRRLGLERRIGSCSTDPDEMARCEPP
jgi:predicted DCC family thiol-disulfide oxidoreductase YuxK